MTVFIVQYHDNSWGAQESSDDILGVYSTMESALKRIDEFQNKGYVAEDDFIFVREYEIDEKVETLSEDYYDNMNEESSD